MKKVGEEEQNKTTRRGMFAHAQSDAETDFEEAPARIHKIQSPNKPGQSGSIGVIKKAQLGTRNVLQAEAENQDNGVVANDDSETNAKKKVGKPPTDIRKHAASLWVPFLSICKLAARRSPCLHAVLRRLSWRMRRISCKSWTYSQA